MYEQESEAIDQVESLARALEGPQESHSTSALAAINQSEVLCQLDAAHKYRRSITRFLKEATSLATVSQEVAESCMYSLPRGGKMITGPSVRLAEIVASAYGNLHVGARVADEEEKFITAQGVAWDMEKNLRVTIEVKRRITKSNGKRFDDDMIGVTGNAAASIALRNAVFRVVPKALVQGIYDAAKRVAVGNAKTLVSRREQVLERLAKMGIDQERVLKRIGKRGIDDIDIEDLETLIGLGTAIKDGGMLADEAFPAPSRPPVDASQDGRRISMKGSKAKPVDAPAHDPETGEVSEPIRERQPGEDDE